MNPVRSAQLLWEQRGRRPRGHRKLAALQPAAYPALDRGANRTYTLLSCTDNIR